MELLFSTKLKIHLNATPIVITSLWQSRGHRHSATYDQTTQGGRYTARVIATYSLYSYEVRDAVRVTLLFMFFEETWDTLAGLATNANAVCITSTDARKERAAVFNDGMVALRGMQGGWLRNDLGCCRLSARGEIEVRTKITRPTRESILKLSNSQHCSLALVAQQCIAAVQQRTRRA